MPVGTGMWIAGGNNNIVRNNRFWDNWRRGAMLFAVPNSLVGGCDAPGPELRRRPTLSTSFRNRFHDNKMGRAPNGTSMPNGDGLLVGQQRHQPARATRPTAGSTTSARTARTHPSRRHRLRSPPTAPTARAAAGSAPSRSPSCCSASELRLFPAENAPGSRPRRSRPHSRQASRTRGRGARGRAGGRRGCGTDEQRGAGSARRPDARRARRARQLHRLAGRRRSTSVSARSPRSRTSSAARSATTGGPRRPARPGEGLRRDGGLLRGGVRAGLSGSTSSTRAPPPSSAVSAHGPGAPGL